MSNAKVVSTWRRRMTGLAKLSVTLGLVWFLLSRADWSAIGITLARIPAGIIIVAFVIMLLSVSISAYKWQFMLKIHGVHFAFARLHRYYFTAVFFNNFLPTSIGGDGYRIYKTFGNPRSTSSSVIAVVMERLTGIIALLVIGYFCSISVYLSRHDEVSGLLLSLGTIGILTALVAAFLFQLLNGFPRLRRWQYKPRLIQIIFDHGKDYLKQPRASIYAMLISFYFHAHNSLTIYLLLRYGVDVTISLPELFVVLTLVNLVAVLPISINGLGVVDTAFVFLLGVYGVDHDASLSVMIISRVLLILLSFIGAAFYLVDKKELPDQVRSPGS